MGATLATVTQITKEIYGPRIVDQLEDETTLLKRIEKTSKGTESTTGGKYVTFPLRTRRNSGIGYRNELEQLQNAGQQGYQSVRVPLRTVTVALTCPARPLKWSTRTIRRLRTL